MVTLMNTTAFDAPNLPESYGFRVDSRRAFELFQRSNEVAASLAHRLLDDAEWVLWDPHADSEGFMLCGNDPHALRREFKAHAECFFDPPEGERNRL